VIKGEIKMYEMKDEYYTGIELIDTQHKELFRIADEAYMLLKDEFVVDKFDDIVAIILRLKDYAIKHFSDEEAYMISIGHKKLFSHKAEHEDFLEKINDVNFADMDHNQTETLLDILEFLNDWLVHHILEKDMLIGKL
jgi:hemerythrin